MEKKTNLNFKNAQFYAGHSLGEYSALCCAGSINFDQTINLLKSRGMAMQNAVPKGEGGMIAVLGIEINKLNEILNSGHRFHRNIVAVLKIFEIDTSRALMCFRIC